MSFFKGKQKKRRSVWSRFFGHRVTLIDDTRAAVTGRKTILSLLGAATGGIMVGRSLWEYTSEAFGLPATIMIGLTIFTVSGILLHSFLEK